MIWLTGRMEKITEGITRKNEIVNKHLGLIEYLTGYDLEHETKYADKMASLFYEYSQCLLKADGLIDGEEESKLKIISELIQTVEKFRNFISSGKPEKVRRILNRLWKISTRWSGWKISRRR